MRMTPETAGTMRDDLTASLVHESSITLKVLRAIPTEALDYRPHSKSMSMSELAWHVVRSESWFIHSLLSGAFVTGGSAPGVPEQRPSTIDAIAAAYETLTGTRLEELRAADGQTLAREVDFMGIISLPAVKFLNLCIYHSIHHRGQLTVYLRLVDAPVPSTYGPSADDNPYESS